MSLNSAIKRSLAVACYYFCILTLVYSLAMIAIYDIRANMSVFTVMLFYPFSFIIVFANEMLQASQLKGFGRAVVRYFAIMFALWLCIYLPNSRVVSMPNAVIIFAVLTLLYALGILVFTVIRSEIKRKNNKKTEYKSVYGDSKRK